MYFKTIPMVFFGDVTKIELFQTNDKCLFKMLLLLVKESLLKYSYSIIKRWSDIRAIFISLTVRVVTYS